MASWTVVQVLLACQAAMQPENRYVDNNRCHLWLRSPAVATAAPLYCSRMGTLRLISAARAGPYSRSQEYITCSILQSLQVLDSPKQRQALADSLPDDLPGQSNCGAADAFSASFPEPSAGHEAAARDAFGDWHQSDTSGSGSGSSPTSGDLMC